MIAADDPFAPLLHEFLDINYKVDQRHENHGSKPSQPLNFHDRHINAALRLKTIVQVPWIPTALRRVCGDAIKEFTSAGHLFEYNANYRKITATNEPLDDYNSEGVAGHFFIMMLRRCFGFASKLIFSPKDRQWFPFLSFRRDFITGTFFKSCYTTLAVPKNPDSDEWSISIPPETQSELADWVIPKLRAIGSEKSFVNYEFYVNNHAGEDLLRKIGPCAEFNWEVPTTVGAETPSSMFSQSHNSAAMNSLFPELASSKPCSQKPPKKVKKKSRRVVPPIERPPEHRERSYRVNVNHFIQLAWTNAIENDASFIVMHCGRYERIGIRHRKTQTLYLSDLIDTTCVKGYGQIHLGLLIAAIKDCLEQVDINETPKDRKRKRPPKERPTVLNSMKDKATRRKRQKLNPRTNELETQLFDNELGKRDLALLHLCFDYYHSPAPSSFRRMEPSCAARPFSSRPYLFKRKRVYPPENYITVIADRPHVGEGAVGVAYKVSVEIETSSGEKQQRNMVMKLAMGPKKDKMIEEYKAYKKLAEAKVTHGIVGVHGLFHDMETGAMIILMDDAGITLRDRALAYGESVELLKQAIVETSIEEMEAYLKVLQGIQSANISHGDIRIDNLMINDQGEVFIIDFDCMADGASDEDLYQLVKSTGWADLLDHE